MTLRSQSPSFTVNETARLGLVLALFSLLLAPLGLLADKAVVPLVIATAAAGGFALGRGALPWRILDRRLALALGLIFVWCLLATFWTFQPPEAANLAVRVGVLLGVLLYLVALAQRLGEAERKWVRQGFCLGFAVAVVLVIIELALGGPIFDLLGGPVRNAYTADSRLNRGVSALAILAWPLAAFLWQRRHLLPALLLVPAVFAVTLFSQSSASMLALGFGLLAAALAALGRSAARIVMVLTVIGALISPPFAVDLLQKSGIDQSSLMPETGLYRLHIWGVVTERIAERPVLGWGFDSSPNLPTGDAQPFRTGEKIIPSHPHNGALQIMVELGSVGSLLVLVLLFLIGMRIDALPRAPRACATAMLVTILGIACTAYSIWQSHWLVIIGGSAAVFVAILRPTEN
ncbi:MAG: O-antigen ligase family protein [Kiloniellaceae bacterium]